MPYLLNAQEPRPPDTYKDLKQAYEELFADYLEMEDIALDYKALYEETEKDLEASEQDVDKYRTLYESAERDNERLLGSVERWKGLYQTEREMVKELLKRKNIGVITGVNIVPANIEKSGVIVGFDFRF